MGFVKLAAVGDIAPGTSKKVERDGEAVLVFNVGGTFYAISNTCPHRRGDLSKGTCEGGVVTCPEHGARFEVKTGANVEGAKLLWWKLKVKDARSYPVRVEGDDVLVGIG